MKTSEILNNTVWATIKPSKINGIGVFAIRDIPKGTEITTNTIENNNVTFHDIDEQDFNNILPEIRELILDRMLYEKDHFDFIVTPNADVVLQSFMNHSKTPNTDGRKTLRYIIKGEELTEDYTPFISKGHPVTKAHISKFV